MVAATMVCVFFRGNTLKKGGNMYSASDLKKNLKVEIDGHPYTITEFNFVKPGKGQGVYTCRLKNLLTGATMVKNYRSGDKIDECKIEEKTLTYSYAEGQTYIFTDKEYNEVRLTAEVLGRNRFFLIEDIQVSVVYHDDSPIDVVMPTFVEKKIIFAEAAVRGDTATNVLKIAKIENGYEIHVPLFVKEGDIVKIDTRTGEYADRVAKK
jgi:elongation factor P